MILQLFFPVCPPSLWSIENASQAGAAREKAVLALEPENQPIEYSQLLDNTLMALRQSLIEIATVIGMKHWTPPETNICSALKQCLCQGGFAALDKVFFWSSHLVVECLP
jgi:hypothetical protein